MLNYDGWSFTRNVDLDRKLIKRRFEHLKDCTFLYEFFNNYLIARKTGLFLS